MGRKHHNSTKQTQVQVAAVQPNAVNSGAGTMSGTTPGHTLTQAKLEVAAATVAPDALPNVTGTAIATPPSQTVTQAKQKPVDRFISIAAFIVSFILVLFAKTSNLVVLSCLGIFTLSVWPLWNFWWIEKALWRRVTSLVLSAGLISFMGVKAWPVPAAPSISKQDVYEGARAGATQALGNSQSIAKITQAARDGAKAGAQETQSRNLPVKGKPSAVVIGDAHLLRDAFDLRQKMKQVVGQFNFSLREGVSRPDALKRAHGDWKNHLAAESHSVYQRFADAQLKDDSFTRIAGRPEEAPSIEELDKSIDGLRNLLKSAEILTTEQPTGIFMRNSAGSKLSDVEMTGFSVDIIDSPSTDVSRLKLKSAAGTATQNQKASGLKNSDK